MKIPFRFRSGDSELQGLVDRPSDPNAPFVLYLPGISGGGLSPKTDPLSEAFVDRWFAFARFEFRSYETSESFDSGCLGNDVEDAKNAVAHLKDEFGMGNFFVVAKSFGALRSFFLKDGSISGFGLLAPAIFVSEKPTAKSLFDTPYGKIGRVEDFRIAPQDLEEWAVPTIIVHGGNDATVPYENSRALLAGIPKNVPKALSRIPGAGHSFGGDGEISTAAGYVANFFGLRKSSHSSSFSER